MLLQNAVERESITKYLFEWQNEKRGQDYAPLSLCIPFATKISGLRPS